MAFGAQVETSESREIKDPLLRPFKLKHLELKNRLMSTSHAIGYQEDGKPKERYQLYHEEKAKGGIALTMFGGSSNVAPDSASIFGQLYVGDDDIIPYFRQFADRIHDHGCALMCQITHMGRRTSPYLDNWLPIIAPSRVPEHLNRTFPKAMDRDDIERVIKAYGDAAWRCREGGLDGCEVIAASHLVGQFLSPLVNKRTDEFGGSLENRARFGRMVLEEIRRRVGPDYIVGLRMPVTEGDDGGMGVDECLEAAKFFERSGLIDFFNLFYGRMDTELALAEFMMPGMAARIAPYLEDIGAFRRALSLPVFHATRITDVATARHAVRQGLVDMVGMTRAHIADPHIVNKIRAGQEHRIRPCVGATYCNSQRRVCIHNPSIGREAKLPHIMPKAEGAPRKVVVVGGGPAGLEASRVCAERGHRVVLFEAASELGGQLLIAARAGWRRDMRGIVDWLVYEAEELGADLQTNCLAGQDDVLAQEPDVVIVATGGLPDLDWLEGAEHCTTTWDVLGGAIAPGENVLVFDGLGQSQAPSCADYLAAQGARVDLVSPEQMFAIDVNYNERVIQRKRLYERGVKITLDTRIVRVERVDNGLRAILANTLTGAPEERLVDQVVIERGTIPVDELYTELTPMSRNLGALDIEAMLERRSQQMRKNPDGAFELYRVGDAVACRDVHAAMLDSRRLCVTL